MFATTLASLLAAPLFVFAVLPVCSSGGGFALWQSAGCLCDTGDGRALCSAAGFAGPDGSVLSAVPSGFWSFDRSDNVTVVDQAPGGLTPGQFRGVAGVDFRLRSRDDSGVLGRPFASFLPTRDRARSISAVRRCLTLARKTFRSSFGFDPICFGPAQAICSTSATFAAMQTFGGHMSVTACFRSA